MEAGKSNLERIRFLRNLTLVLAGLLIAGLPSGFLGTGSGVLLLPAVAYLYGLTGGPAHGASLVVASVTSLIGTLMYSSRLGAEWTAMHGWSTAGLLVLGSIAGAMLGGRIGVRQWFARNRRYLVLILVPIGALMLTSLSPAMSFLGGSATHAPGPWVVLSAGVVAGFLSGLLGVGGGVMVVPVLVLLMGFPETLAHGVSLAVIIPASVIGAAMHGKLGNMRTEMALWLSLGGAIGVVLGARLALAVGPSVLQAAFGVFLILLAVMKSMRSPQPDVVIAP